MTFSGVVLATSLAWRMGSVIICPLLYISVLVGLVPIRFPSLLVIVTIVGVVVVLVGILIPRPIMIVGPTSLGFLVIPILLLLSFLLFTSLEELSPFFLDLGQTVLGSHCSFDIVCYYNRGLVPTVNCH